MQWHLMCSAVLMCGTNLAYIARHPVHLLDTSGECIHSEPKLTEIAQLFLQDHLQAGCPHNLHSPGALIKVM